MLPVKHLPPRPDEAPGSLIGVAQSGGAGNELYMQAAIIEDPDAATTEFRHAGDGAADSHGSLLSLDDIRGAIVPTTNADDLAAMHR